MPARIVVPVVVLVTILIGALVWSSRPTSAFVITYPRPYGNVAGIGRRGTPAGANAVTISATVDERGNTTSGYALQVAFQPAGSSTGVSIASGPIAVSAGPTLNATISQPQGMAFNDGDIVAVTLSGVSQHRFFRLSETFSTAFQVVFVRPQLGLKVPAVPSRGTGIVTVQLNTALDVALPVNLSAAGSVTFQGSSTIMVTIPAGSTSATATVAAPLLRCPTRLVFVPWDVCQGSLIRANAMINSALVTAGPTCARIRCEP